MVIKIECNRSIRKLNIEFADDGSPSSSEDFEFEESYSDTQELKTKHQKPSKSKNPEKLLSLDDSDIPEVEQEIIEIPQIEEKERAPLVSEDMQNLSF